MKTRQTAILYAKRTAIGRMCGGLSTVPAPLLGATLVKDALTETKIDPKTVDEIIMGNVLTAGMGQGPARQAGIHGGLTPATRATMINRLCGSGLKAVIQGHQAILLGDATVVFAGGQENMTRAPHLLLNTRAGYKYGGVEAPDSMQYDGLTDAYTGNPMGLVAEACAKEYGLTREAQDEYAIESYTRAQNAIKGGHFAREIIPVEVKIRKKVVEFKEDEEPNAIKFDKVPALRAAFAKDGTITAANASSIDDGAALAVLMDWDEAIAKGYKPVARIVSYASHAQDPGWFTTAPVGATRKVLDRAGWTVDDIDVFELNEAFSCVPMAAMKDLGIPHDKLNIYGGAVALGHPIGASGARILATLLNVMEERGAKRGLAGLCIGGGEADAVVVERV